MKVFNLSCASGHSFEGWFGSIADYEQQRERGLLTCPLCDSYDVTRMPSAPRLNLGSASAPAGPGPSGDPDARARHPAHPDPYPGAPPQAQAAQAALMALARFVVANTENVGKRFAEEVRRMHYRESPERAIRGQATPEQAEELREEGIDVVSLPFPGAGREDLQ